jgi:tryptophan synthase alpha chain
MNRISETFKRLKNNDKKALIAYISAGDPTLADTYELILEMEKKGVDIVELGIPYSDPLADGPIIQRASQRALASGSNIDNIMEMVTKVREASDIPLVIMVYYNSIFRYGVTKFINQLRISQIDGLIIPDLPMEENRELIEIISGTGINYIPIVSLTSKSRIKEIVREAKGFIYCITSKGVTGMRSSLGENLKDFISTVREYTKEPIALGFGISNKETLKEIKDIADGFIIGSAIIEKIEEGLNDNTYIIRSTDFLRTLREGLDKNNVENAVNPFTGLDC